MQGNTLNDRKHLLEKLGINTSDETEIIHSVLLYLIRAMDIIYGQSVHEGCYVENMRRAQQAVKDLFKAPVQVYPSK